MLSKSFVVTAFLLLWAPALLAQDILSVNRASQNVLGQGVNDNVGPPALSPNSDRIVFASKASNLVLGDTNDKFDIFLRDLSDNKLSRISVPAFGGESDGGSFAPSISPSSPNRFFAIAFESDSTNIAKRSNLFPDTNGFRDIFLSVPRRADFLERISLANGAIEANGDSTQAAVTVLPRENTVIIAYTSSASNLVASDTNQRDDIFVASVNLPKDQVFDPTVHIATERIAPSHGSLEADGHSAAPAISSDGQFIVFESAATNLVEGLAPAAKQIYLYDRNQNQISIVSRDAQGNPANGPCKASSISYNGKFVVFATSATNLVADGFIPDGSSLQIMLFNRQTGQITRVNTSADGTPGNGQSGDNVQAVVSADGRFVMFSDSATNLVPDDTNGVLDIFIKDLGTSNIVRVSKSLTGEEANGTSLAPSFARRGFNSSSALAVYGSAASNLISGDTEGNNDIFYSVLSIPPLPLSKTTTIEVPPDGTLDDANEILSLALQSFSGAATAKARSQIFLIEQAKKLNINYRIKLEQEDVPRKKADNRTLNSRRNELTLKNLKPGTYNIRYQAQVTKGHKVISRTPYSPRLFFNTLGN